MSSPSNDNEEAASSGAGSSNSGGNGGAGASGPPRPPAKRRLSSAAVIEILDTESDDSDVCAVNSYQASADEVKRIRGDYSSTSSSSSSDYSSDSESSWEDDSVLVEDKFPVKVVKAQLNPRANRMDDPQFNPALKSEDLIDRLSTNWKELKDYSTDNVTFTAEPFRLCLLHNVLANPEIINNIVDDMNTLDWNRKKMDLYEFHQTTDLANLSWQRSIRCIYQLLKTEVMSWVSQVTGLSLQSVSATCSLYGPGDHLLLHDDLLADRRVAFVLYLAPWRPRRPAALHNGAAHAEDKAEAGADSDGGWAEGMGGALELFARDDSGRPTDVVRRVLPRNNMLAFFPVGHDSFHQVDEVVSLELPRLSINGWFHGPRPDGPEPVAPPAPLPPPPAERPHNNVVLLSEWVSSTYMCPRVRAQVQAQMERASEVCLRSVLQPAAAQRLLDALDDPEVEWERCESSQQRRYERVSAQWLSRAAELPAGAQHAAAAALQLLRSAAFLRLLADCTDLPLATYRQLELQRWRPGDFTLIPPREHYQAPRLEAVLYLGVPARAVCGGQTVYVAPEEGRAPDAEGEVDGALVTVPPRHNALSLVYCDAGAASFTKYLSKMTMKPDDRFYILACTYCE
ncbi:prolyl 3-hydroxylase sudestada1 [Epargyreus clarus]|uniref:prolyl 3-hydroxylase sudestada1 n=1 Tax=Epargyreus clarus TaxID=520877 RepID=UPI003C2BBB42